MYAVLIGGVIMLPRNNMHEMRKFILDLYRLYMYCMGASSLWQHFACDSNFHFNSVGCFLCFCRALFTNHKTINLNQRETSKL